MKRNSVQSRLADKKFTAKSSIYGEVIEWEELPSLSDSLEKRLINPDYGTKNQDFARPVAGAAWAQTQPVDLDFAFEPNPFRETLKGLSIREVFEPDIFKHFFGASRNKTFSAT